MKPKSLPVSQKPIPTVSCRLPDGRLAELVYDRKEKKTRLAVGRGEAVTLEEEIVLEEGTRLVPYSPTNNLIKHEVLLLADHPEPFGSVSELVGSIDAYLHRYVDLSESFRTLASCYILLTWVYDAFNELPYLRFRGDYGSGKTRALFVVGSLCYKAFFASGASTVSPIFHTLDAFRGTLVFDEADFRFSDEKSELVKVFNNGNVKGFPVLRTQVTQKKEFEPRAFNVFGPKVVAMRRSFEDQALESRFFTEEMGRRTMREDIPINLPECQKEEALSIRNQLLAYRFMTLPKLRIDESLVDLSLSPRLNQILVPLLSIIEDETLREKVRAMANGLEQELSEKRQAMPEAALVAVLDALFADGTRIAVSVGEITAELAKRHAAPSGRPLTHRYVGELLRQRLGIVTYKSHGVYVVPGTAKERIKALRLRYGMTEDSIPEAGPGSAS